MADLASSEARPEAGGGARPWAAGGDASFGARPGHAGADGPTSPSAWPAPTRLGAKKAAVADVQRQQEKRRAAPLSLRSLGTMGSATSTELADFQAHDQTWAEWLCARAARLSCWGARTGTTSGRPPRSYLYLDAKRKRIQRDLVQPLVYVFLLACFVVMLQLTPSIRSYGARWQIEQDLTEMLELGKGPPATPNGFGPSGLGTRSQPGMCPSEVLNAFGDLNAGEGVSATIVDPEVEVSPANKAFQWLIQAGRLLHRPTRCPDCSFGDATLYRTYSLIGQWVEVAAPDSNMPITAINLGVAHFDALSYDFAEGGKTDNFVAGERVNRELFGEQTMKPEHWESGESFGFALGLSKNLQALMEERCSATGGPGVPGTDDWNTTDWLACELARFKSTVWLNANDVCAPLVAFNLEKGIQLLTANDNCIAPTAVYKGNCPTVVTLKVHTLLKTKPLSLSGELVTPTDGLWVLVTYDASNDDLSFEFLPIDLYPGAQGVALAVFQVLFCVFTVWFLLRPVAGRLWLYMIRYRTRRGESWPRCLGHSLMKASTRLWFWSDILTLVLMLLTCLLYGAFVARHKDVQGDLLATEDVSVGRNRDNAANSSAVHNVLDVNCCGEFNATSTPRGGLESELGFVWSPLCCASPFGTCWSACTASDFVALTEWGIQMENVTSEWLAEEYVDGATNSDAINNWLGPPWFDAKDAANISFVNATIPANESCWDAGRSQTWCGTNNGMGCGCEPTCREKGDCCLDYESLCEQGGDRAIDWFRYEVAASLRYQMRPPRFTVEPLANGSDVDLSTFSVPGQYDAQQWFEAKALKYDDLYYSGTRAANAEYDWLIALAFVSVFLFARMLKYARIDSRMSLLLHTFAYAAGSIFFFLLTFALLFLGFVFMAQVYLGRILIEGYLTFFEAFTSAFNLLFDSFDSDLFPGASSWPFWLWYFTYMVFITLVQLNLIVAILVGAFDAARAHAAAGGDGTKSRTIATTFAEYKALRRAVRRRPDGSIDTARVYAVYSGRTPEEVERAAVCIQRRYRGHQVRRKTLERTGQSYTSNLSIAAAAHRAASLRAEAEVLQASAGERDAMLAMALRRLQGTVERLEGEVKAVRADARRASAASARAMDSFQGAGGSLGSAASGLAVGDMAGGALGAGGWAQPRLADGTPSPAPAHLSLRGVPSEKRAGRCVVS